MRFLLATLIALFLPASGHAQVLFSQPQTVVNFVAYSTSVYGDANACTGPGHNDNPAMNSLLTAYSPNWWAAGTTYAAGAVVYSNDGFYYTSLINSNLGNNPAFNGNPSYWTQGAPFTPIVIQLPPNQTCTFGLGFSPCGSYVVPYTATIPIVTFYGPGTTVQMGDSTYAGFFGCTGFDDTVDNNWKGQPFATVAAGAKCVIMTTHSTAADFPVGSWAATGGVVTQWPNDSYPPNFAFFQFVQIASENSSTGQVCFTTALAHNYESTWPSYVGLVEGPGALYPMENGWQIRITWEGNAASPMTMIVGSGVGYASGSNLFLALRYVNYTGTSTQNTLIQTATKYALLDHVTITAPNGQIEIDKEIETLDFENSTMAEGTYAFVQSSPVNIIFNNSIGYFSGTPNSFVCNNSTLTGLYAGVASFYGVSQSFIGNNCMLNSYPNWFSIGFQAEGTGNIISSISNGVIAIANSNGPVANAVPGGNYFLGPCTECGGGIQKAYFGVPFQIMDMTQDANYTYLHTTLSGDSLPTFTYPYNSKIAIIPYPIPQWTCNNCTGAGAVPLQGQPAATPLYSYNSQTIACGAMSSLLPTNQFGPLVSATYDVTVADTTQMTLLADAENTGTVPAGGGSSSTYVPVINLKTTGSRVVTPSGVTGAQSGDSIISPGSAILTSIQAYNGIGGDQFSISTGSNPATDVPCPSITVTVVTNPTVVNPLGP